jgi:hypothetical protein
MLVDVVTFLVALADDIEAKKVPKSGCAARRVDNGLGLWSRK